MVKKIILAISFLSLQAVAQEHYTGISTSKRGGLVNGYLNPAELVNMNMKFDINLFNTSINFSNNKLTFSDLTKGDNLEDKFFSGSEATNVRIDGLILGPGLAFKNGNWAYAISTAANFKANLVNVDVALGNAIQNGNSSSLFSITNLNTTENQRLNATTWGEIDLSVARKLAEIGRHKVSAGATLKLLFPGAYANFSVNKLNGTLVNNFGNLGLTNASASVNLSYSGVLGKDFNDSGNFSDFFSQGINGVAADIGFTYTYKEADSNNYILNAGLSIKNIGSMKFKSDSNTSIDYNLNVNGSQVLDMNQFENVSSLSQLEEILMQPQNAPYFQKTKSTQSFNVKLPTTINLYADLKLAKKWFVTGSLLQKVVDDSKYNLVTAQNTYTLIPRFSGKLVEFFAPLTINEISGFTSGFGFRIAGFYIGSSSVISAATNNSKQADIYLGFRVGF